MSWDRAKKMALESIAARAGCESSGRLPTVFGPTAELLTASIGTVGLFVLDGLFRAKLPVSMTINDQVLAGMHNNVTAESAERASDYLARALLVMGFYSPFSQQADDPIEGRLIDYYNRFRPHPEDLDDLEALAERFPRVDRAEVSEDEFERQRIVFCIEAGRRGVELAMERELPDSVDEFMTGGYYHSSYVLTLRSYQELWIEASDHLNQTIAKTARVGYERSQEEERRNAAAVEGSDGGDDKDRSSGRLSWRERFSLRLREFDGKEAAAQARTQARSATQAVRKRIHRFRR